MDQNPTILVRKSTGEMEPFSKAKLVNSLKRSGAEDELVEEIAGELDQVLHDGISTSKLYARVFALLRRKKAAAAARYRLKKAIMELGPTGYPFEIFISEIIRLRGFDVEVGQVLEGRCVSHEVDVLATAKGEQYFVECKYYNSQGKHADVKVPLYIHSRVNDLIARRRTIPGYEDMKFGGWIATNTRFTSDAIAYGTCSGLKLLSWDFPADDGIKDIVEREKLFPVTALTRLSRQHKQQLLEDRIVLCRQLHENHRRLDKLQLSADQRLKVEKEISGLCG
jgi:hypothetical protein